MRVGPETRRMGNRKHAGHEGNMLVTTSMQRVTETWNQEHSTRLTNWMVDRTAAVKMRLFQTMPQKTHDRAYALNSLCVECTVLNWIGQSQHNCLIRGTYLPNFMLPKRMSSILQLGNCVCGPVETNAYFVSDQYHFFLSKPTKRNVIRKHSITHTKWGCI